MALEAGPNTDAGGDVPEASAPAPIGKPYHPKRAHRKSRTGCRNCKTRRVKCDEAKPTCRACSLRKERCDYAPQPSLRQPGSASQSPPAVQPATPTPMLAIGSLKFSPPVGVEAGIENLVEGADHDLAQSARAALPLYHEPLFRPGGADDTEMRLLWFYTASTHGSFTAPVGRFSQINEILKVRVVQHAFGSPFLMQTLLALAALHLEYLKCEEALNISRTKALHYRASAFAGYRQAIQEARPETYPALLATSLLLCAVASQTFREPDAPPLYILDYMVVWRGIGLIVGIISHEGLDNSGIGALFFRPPVDLDASASHIPSNLFFMISSVKPGDPDYPCVQTYHDTLKHLGALYQELKNGFSYTLDLRIIVFFTLLPRDFIELCRERRPRALVILAHWLSFAKMVRSIWWMEGVGEQALPHVADVLGSDPESDKWLPVIQVPLVVRGLNRKPDIAGALLESHGWDIEERSLSHSLNAGLAEDYGKDIRKQDLMTNAGEFRFPGHTAVTMRPRPIEKSTLYEAIRKSTPSSSESNSSPSSGIYDEDMFEDTS